MSSALCGSLENAINTSSKPKNIGAGIYARQCANNLQMISKASKVTAKVLNVISYGSVVIDVGYGIYNNINNNSSTKKIVLDAIVDVTISGGSVWASAAMGSFVGTAVGTVLPVARNANGAGVGFVVGIGIYALTDMISFNGKSARNHMKEGVNGLW